MWQQRQWWWCTRCETRARDRRGDAAREAVLLVDRRAQLVKLRVEFATDARDVVLELARLPLGTRVVVQLGL